MQRLTQFTQLRQIGQSIWLDNLARGMIEGGDLKRLVDAGEVTGITTNPSIFRNAIANGAASTDTDSGPRPSSLTMARRVGSARA